MIRAILDSRKTQTRRVMKLDEITAAGIRGIMRGTGPVFAFCPYGQPGDRLWVREAFFAEDGLALRREHQRGQVYYRANVNIPVSFKWKPSIHMPRWASRITLEITKVRVERVQEISEEDVRAEGIQVVGYGDYPDQFSGKHLYQELWDKLNREREGGKYAWARNPWVWVLEFRRLDDSASRG
jgi:hypothetical protein